MKPSQSFLLRAQQKMFKQFQEASAEAVKNEQILETNDCTDDYDRIAQAKEYNLDVGATWGEIAEARDYRIRENLSRLFNLPKTSCWSEINRVRCEIAIDEVRKKLKLKPKDGWDEIKKAAGCHTGDTVPPIRIIID